MASLVNPSQGSHRGTILVTAAGLVYVLLLGLTGMVTPKGMNFDWFYLFGCALIGWAVGVRAALVLVVTSSAFLVYHDAVLGPAWQSAWITWWNSVTRLTAFGAIAWLAGQAGRLTRNLEQSVNEQTARLETEVSQHKQTAEFLNEALELFRQVTENITDVFCVWDATKSRVEYISPGFERVWGKSCRELYESPSAWLEGVHPEDRQRVMRAIFTKQLYGDYDEEYRVVRPDKALRWVHDRAFPVKDENGAVYRIVCIAEDITERKRAEQLLQAERDLGSALSATSDSKIAAERVLDTAMKLEAIDCGGFYLMNEQTGELRLVAHRGLTSDFVERVRHYKTDATETRLARASRVTYVGHEQMPRSLEVLWGSHGLRALAVVPLKHQGVVLGMIMLASFSENELPAQLRLGIELIATQVAAAFARINTEESLRRSEAQLRKIIQSAPIALLAFDERGMITFEDGLALAAMGATPAQHLGRSAAQVYSDFPLMAENVRRALANEEFNSTVHFGDTVLEYRFAPIRYKGATRPGFIAVATNITERFRLEKQILEISDREQARIGQDVHDGLCQQLVGAAFAANSLEQSLRSEDRAEAKQAQRICALLYEAMTESRRVARGLYPLRLKTEGLGPALVELSRAVTERFDIPCGCDERTGPAHCDITTATHLYRIAQEAVNNAVKHSGARNISIKLFGSDTGIDIEVHDDGKGLDRSGKLHSGMGFHTMEYRARTLRGQLHIRSDNRGTTVCCHVPQLFQ